MFLLYWESRTVILGIIEAQIVAVGFHSSHRHRMSFHKVWNR